MVCWNPHNLVVLWCRWCCHLWRNTSMPTEATSLPLQILLRALPAWRPSRRRRWLQGEEIVCVSVCLCLCVHVILCCVCLCPYVFVCVFVCVCVCEREREREWAWACECVCERMLWPCARLYVCVCVCVCVCEICCFSSKMKRKCFIVGDNQTYLALLMWNYDSLLLFWKVVKMNKKFPFLFLLELCVTFSSTKKTVSVLVSFGCIIKGYFSAVSQVSIRSSVVKWIWGLMF